MRARLLLNFLVVACLFLAVFEAARELATGGAKGDCDFEFDLGDVVAGESHSFSVSVLNPLKKSIRVADPSASCGCTEVRVLEREYSANEHIEIVGRLLASDSPRITSVSLHLPYHAGGTTGSFRIKLTATIVPPVAAPEKIRSESDKLVADIE